MDGSGPAATYTAPSYYTLSVILGTVALSYGSVPLYKMVSPAQGPPRPREKRSTLLTRPRFAKRSAGAASPSASTPPKPTATSPLASSPSPTPRACA